MDIKRRLKNLLPFSIRHSIQCYLAQHPELRKYVMQKNPPQIYSKIFEEMLDSVGIKDFLKKTVCEVGPGEFLYNAFYEYQMGAVKEYLIDVEDWAGVGNGKQGYDEPRIALSSSLEINRELPNNLVDLPLGKQLEKINAVYSIEGIGGYSLIMDASVDFIFSNVVLQHIRKREFEQTIGEMSRIMKLGAIAFHTVDLRDMLGGHKRHLEIPSNVWEDDIHYSMPCYTNRIQCNQMCDVFEKKGFSIMKVERGYFDDIPVKKNRLIDEFKDIPEEELMTSQFSIILKKESDV